MERLDFSNNTAYSAVEASIHLNRYAFAKPFCQGARVLDAACGQGYGSYLIKTWGAREVVGIDIDADTIRRASQLFKQDGLRYQQHSVENLPFEDHSFDVIVSFETIEHIDHPEKFLLEIKRVLKPGGTVVISCPNDNYYYENDCAKNPFHKRAYTFFEFKEMAERHLGFRGEYYLAFALDGFINIPFEMRTEPEQEICEDALGMLHYENCDSALCVPQQRFLNHWNANYYIGVWNGRGAQYRYSSVISPRETFIDHKDKDYDLLRHFDQMKKEYRSCQSELITMKQAEETTKGQVMETERLKTLLELARTERDEVRQHMYNRSSEIERLNLLIEQAGRERDEARLRMNDQTMEIERLRLLVDMTRRERDEARRHMHENWDYYQAAKLRIEGLESSRGVKLLGKLYNLREKLKRLFH